MPRVHRYFKELRLRQLRAIVELARRGSFAEVARALDLSVASVWQQIRGMEKEFGVPLVQVVGRQVEIDVREGTSAESLERLQSGEAVTRDTAGELIGAKSFSMLNLEYELALTQRISAVVFWDALGITARIADLPWEDTLHAAGVGVRYNTVIGPIRLEYGHNLNPRPTDPAGTLHLSIGYPF